MRFNTHKLFWMVNGNISMSLDIYLCDDDSSWLLTVALDVRVNCLQFLVSYCKFIWPDSLFCIFVNIQKFFS